MYKRHQEVRSQALSKQVVLYRLYAGRLGPRHAGAPGPANNLVSIQTDIILKFRP